MDDSGLTEFYHRKVENFDDALGKPETRMEAVEAIHPLIERITLKPSDDGFQIELVGEIANMHADQTDRPPMPSLNENQAFRSANLVLRQIWTELQRELTIAKRQSIGTSAIAPKFDAVGYAGWAGRW